MLIGEDNYGIPEHGATQDGKAFAFEAQINAQKLREQAYKKGETLVVTPLKARVFSACA